MSTSPSSTVLGAASMASTLCDNKAYWTQEDEAALIHFLTNHKSQAGNRVNFKMNTFVAASQDLMKKITLGGLKTPSACRSKWARVSTDPCRISH